MDQERETQSVIRLYEQDYTKPELSDEFLEHHGILGMHWGRRNGPPYPLDSDVSTGKRLKKGGSVSKHKARKTYKKRVKSLKRARKARDEKRAEEQKIQKSKEEIIKTKDISAMLKNVDNFTNQEINDMLNRLDTEGRLADRVAKQTKAEQSRGQKAANLVKESVSKGLESGARSLISTVSENALKMGVRQLAKEAGSSDEKTQELIDKLFKEKKK